MEVFFDLLEILGHWLVFSFSLYEGLLNLSEHAEFAKKYIKHIGALRIKPAERVILPLYFYKIKKFAVKVAKEENMPFNDASQLLKLIDRAILWIYLSIGGWLVWLCALFLLVKDHTAVHGAAEFLAFAALGTFLGLINVIVRIKMRRRRLCELADCDGIEKEKEMPLP